MGIESKQLMMYEISKAVSDVLTVKQSEEVLQILAEVTGKYDIERVESDYFDIDGDDLLEAFLSAKQVEGKSDKTINHYRYIIKRVQRKVNLPIRKITIFHIRNYFAKEKARGISDYTLKGEREVLSSFFGWLHKEGLLQVNPITNFSPIKYPKIKKLPYTEVDVEKIKDKCKTPRDIAIVSFLRLTGCRIEEMCKLNIEDIDLQQLQCTVFGKGSKERIVFFDEITAMYLREYLKGRTDSLEALFIGKRMNRFTPGGVRYMLRSIGKRADIEKVHPHRFRRTLATTLIEHGMPIQEVAMLLGHERIDTTMTYVYINESTVKNSYRKYA